MVAKPARDLIPEWDGQANTLERFEEDVLIFTHAVPKERRVIIGPKLLQTVSKGFSTEREIGLELLKLGVLQLQDGATQLLKLIRLRLEKDLQQDVSEHSKRTSLPTVDATQCCRGIKPAGTSIAGSQIRVHPERRRRRPRRSSRMCCVDFSCWKTRHSQDPIKYLSSALLVKVTRTVTL